ncbi:MAG: ABC transporter ATP-binding protein [Lachnospiraceae bacterium]|nr:ABC transporter ATP-binding protein [Lachnospiraceae bacterium]
MFKKVNHYAKRIKEGRLKEIVAQLKWIYRYARSHKFAIGIYTLLGLSGTVVSLLGSLVSRDLVDIITGHNTGALLTTFCLMIGTTLGGTFIGQASNYISTKVGMTVDNEIKASLFDEIMNVEWESLSKYRSGELVARWSGDASRISSGILNMLPNLIIYIFRFFSSLILVIRYDASFAIFALAGIPISLFISRSSMRRMQKNNMGTLKVSTELSAFNQETFANVQTVKAFDMLSLYSKRLRALQKEYLNVQLKYQKAEIFNAIIMTFVSMLVSYSAQGWGIYKVWSGAITYGTMTMFITLSTTLSSTVNSLLGLFPTAIGIANSSKRLMDITTLPKEDYGNRDEVKEFFDKHRIEGVGLSIRDVTYAYPGSDIVFEDVFAEAHPHEVVAFVGPSGEGKTTMLRFLLSIIRAQNGEGFICAGDGTPENGGECMKLSASARQLFAYVPQGNTMFSGTIASNMRNVKEDATDEEIIEALKLACAWRFVEKLPDGINSEIMERGGGFSEGQSQRLSIARALLRKSPILLLDEATSALDIATEREVLKNIMCDNYPRTCIVTTHRPSVLNVCSRVYSISDKKCTVMDKDAIDKMISDF